MQFTEKLVHPIDLITIMSTVYVTPLYFYWRSEASQQQAGFISLNILEI